MTRFTSHFFTLLTVVAVGCLLFITSACAAGPGDAVAAKCRKDLAGRLKVPAEQIAVVDVQAKVWPDAALGMPEPGKVYAQVQTPGWRIVLEAQGTRYLYTASERTCRFGGPLPLWDFSMLYVQPVADEPNLNGDLYQCALAGTNHVRLASGVSSYYPQEKGMILFTRRTSRSGFDLLSMKAGENKEPQRLYSAFAIGAATLNEAQDTWAAFVRPGLGSGWMVVVARIGQQDTITRVALPATWQPQRISLANNRVMIQVSTEKGTTAYYELSPPEATSTWTNIDASRFPGALDYVLNKSETLEITQAGTKEQPSVEVARVWFTGDRKVVATLPGLTLRGDALLGAGYAFIWGEQHGKAAAFTVQISTGEVTPGYHGAGQDFKPFIYPPITKPS